MNVNQTTIAFLEAHPSIKDCVSGGLINYSALTRQIIKDTELKAKDFDAILIACRRYARSHGQDASQQLRIRRLLRESTLEVRTKIAVAVVHKSVSSDAIIELERRARRRKAVYYAIEGSEAITLVISQSLLSDIDKLLKDELIRTQEGLALAMIKSPEDIEETVGSLGHLATLLGNHNVNIVENMSCYNETLFVVKQTDVGAMVAALSL